MRARILFLGALAAATLGAVNDARATGGVLTSPQGASQASDARIAIASTPERTTRWARVTVRGSAGAFVWLLPVKPGAMIDLASDAWMESLEKRARAERARCRALPSDS